jgi:hypothetical protein
VTAQIISTGIDGHWSAGIPLGGTPLAIAHTSRILLGFDGGTLFYLDLAGASPGWLADLRKALDEATPAPVPLAALCGPARYQPETPACPAHGWYDCPCSGTPDYRVDPRMVSREPLERIAAEDSAPERQAVTP